MRRVKVGVGSLGPEDPVVLVPAVDGETAASTDSNPLAEAPRSDYSFERECTSASSAGMQQNQPLAAIAKLGLVSGDRPNVRAVEVKAKTRLGAALERRMSSDFHTSPDDELNVGLSGDWGGMYSSGMYSSGDSDASGFQSSDWAAESGDWAANSGDSEQDSDEQETRPPPAPAFANRADVDGLRAFAVLPVVAYHFELSFPGGYTGVDIFFVISGFLITSIQLKKLERGTFSLVNFWGRRCRRLFPAFATMLTVLLCMGYFLLLPNLYLSLLSQTWPALLMSANVKMYTLDSYWVADASEVPLLHCWSLAVEEQFYICFPLLLVALWRLDRRAILPALVAIFIGSLAVAVVMTPDSPRFTFYLLPARAWELALGGLLAFDPGVVQTKPMAELVSWCGLGLMTASYFGFDEQTSFPGYAALIPCGGAAMLIASQRVESSSTGKLLASKYVVFVGKISYSLYLWHWPIFAMLKRFNGQEMDATAQVLGLSLSSAIAVLSFYFVEETMRSAERVPDYDFFPAAICVWLLLLLFSLCAGEVLDNSSWSSGPWTSRLHFQPDSSSVTGFCLVDMSDIEVDHLYDVSRDSLDWETIVDSKPWGAGDFNYEANGDSPYIVGAGPAGATPTVMFIGSSHCEQYGPIVEHIAEEFGVWVGFMCIDGDHARFSTPLSEWDRLRLATMDEWNTEMVVMADFWGGYYPKLVGAPWLYADYDWDNTLQLLTGHAERVLVLGDVPTIPIQPGNDEVLLAATRWYQDHHNFDLLFDFYEEPSYKQRRLSVENAVTAAALNFPSARLAAVTPYFVNATTDKLQVLNPWTLTLGYKDCNHLNVDGAEMVEQFFRIEVFNQTLCSR